MSKTPMKVIKDLTKQFNDIIGVLKQDEVLVGIPAEDTERKDEDAAAINNATILAINEYGSPSNNIPPRPVMAIGIQNAQDQIAVQMAQAAEKLLDLNHAGVTQSYERAGLIASNSIKKAINSQEGFEGPAESTLKAREARGFKGTKSLIVTGQLRNAITYVINGNSKTKKAG